jgi:hypothetical protein
MQLHYFNNIIIVYNFIFFKFREKTLYKYIKVMYNLIKNINGGEFYEQKNKKIKFRIKRKRV